MSEKTQLTRITVPAITDARYMEGMADAFDKINDNFKKIASLPFLQGVQGDSYQLEEYKIWNDDLSITEDGKVLLDSIFGKDVTVAGSYFDNIRNYIDEELDGVSPIDFFKNGNDIVNNSLYFYVIKDDTGNVIEKQLGQFYYFIDERLKKIGDSYNNENISSTIDNFNDYTGFYQYKYDTKSNEEKYIRLEILPSIYYDKNKNDICWKFNGNETGISAIGINGSDGKDADLLIVKVTANENDCTGVVNAIINPHGSNNSTEQWYTEPSNFKAGKALICIQRDDVAQDFAYGQVIQSGSDYNAYWDPNYNFSKLIGDNRITNYFYNMGGEDETATAPFYLAIPSYNNRGPSGTTEDKKKAHVIDGKNTSGGSNLRIFHADKVFDENGNQQWNPTPTPNSTRTLGIENYNVDIANGLTVGGTLGVTGAATLGSNLSVGGTLGVTGAATLGNNVKISGTLDVDGVTKIGSGSVNSYTENDGALVVSGGIGVTKSVNIGEDLTIENKLTVKGTNGASSYNNADVTIHGGVGIGKSVIVGQSGKMIIENQDEVQKTGAALTVYGDILSLKNIIARTKSQSKYSVLTGANDSSNANGKNGLGKLVTSFSEGTIFSGGGPDITSIGPLGIDRTVYNRIALQSYHTDSSKKYSTHEYNINPCGGQVFINKYVGGPSNALSASNALVVDGGLYARTKKPSAPSKVDGSSNVLIGHNDPGNTEGGFDDFPKDLDKGGYPLVIKTFKGDGTVNDGAMVFGMGDIYALSGNTTNGWSAGTLYLNHRIGYRGDVQIGKDLNVGDSTVGGNVTIHQSSSSNGKLTVKGTKNSTATNDGALVVTGGAGIGMNLNVGGTLGVTGAATIGGTLGVTGAATIGSNLSVGGKATIDHGIKVTRKSTTDEIGFYSGSGSSKDTNILKVDSDGVFVNGGAGKLILNGDYRKLIIGGLTSDNKTLNHGICIDNENDNTSTILFKGKNESDPNYSNQMLITTNATRGSDNYTVGRFYMGNNFDKQFIQIFTGWDDDGVKKPIYGNSKSGIQIVHDEGNPTVDRVDIKPKLSVDGFIDGKGIKIINGESKGIGFYSGAGGIDDNILNVKSSSVNISGNVGKLIIGGTADLTTNADYNSTGSLQVAGGAFIKNKLYIGSDAISDKPSTGALVVTGGAGIGKELNIGKHLFVNKYSLDGTEESSEIYGHNAIDGTSKNTANGCNGLYVKGGDGVLTSIVGAGDGGAGLIVKGGKAGDNTSSKFYDAGRGGDGLIAYAGDYGKSNGKDPGTFGNYGNAIRACGNVVIEDEKESYITQLNTSSITGAFNITNTKKININSTTEIDGDTTIDGNTNIEGDLSVRNGTTSISPAFYDAQMHGKIFHYNCHYNAESVNTFNGDVCILGYDDSTGDLKDSSVNMYYLLKNINGDVGDYAVIGFGENFPENSIVLLTNYTDHGLDFIRYATGLSKEKLICHHGYYNNGSNVLVILGPSTSTFIKNGKTYKIRKPLYYINLGSGRITDEDNDTLQ